ncbi:VOC family protein [Chitinophaga agri]|uniref:Glyoxalase/bleomycin resistance/extradiol dioxygenase family protein n=1 Tax=Chitinophaga agri TaxID=2703787 RepID=A0A6B9ZCL2_9BACT|nr:VOC family protein [Chitinophaga agri]QHS59231.1 glyoxalase/bleomycin resistance/extradiol dioxygenase family protein [Chitinophaga agri]
MKIDHLAIWVDNLELMKNFYLTYFNTTCNERYHNPVRKFTSYFISFNEGGARIELMHQPDIDAVLSQQGRNKGLAHFAITVGSRQEVNDLLERLRTDHFRITGEPRVSGDGYYEAVFSDPEGNVIELLADK